MPKASPRTEASIERAVCAYAKLRGMFVRKMNGLGYAGWPDRFYVPKSGRIFFIEFKRAGGVTTPLQDRMIDGLRARMLNVYVVDSVERGKEIIDEHA